MAHMASKAKSRAIAKHLRYMHPEDIAEDFPSKKERAAIAAVFTWLSFNSICVRELKRSGHYAANMPRRAMSKALFASKHCVIENAAVDKAEKTLGIDKLSDKSARLRKS